MSLPLLAHENLHDFPLGEPLIAQESFHYDGEHYAGVQPSAYESSERSWDNGDPVYPAATDATRGLGRWVGPGAIHDRPGLLWLEASPGIGADEETLGHDTLARIEADSAPLATFSYSSVGFVAASGDFRIVLQDAATGNVLHNATVPDTARSHQLPAIAAHAILWMRLEAAQKPWSLPDDYLSVRGFASIPNRFKYRESSIEYVWDYEADVGRRPTNQNQLSYTGINLWNAHRALVLSGGLLHRGAWTQYITDGTPLDGPWSALRIAVGEDDFAVGESFQPYPGAVLYRLDDEDSRTPVLLDPLALSVSCWHRLRHASRPHDSEVAGTIATRSGPATALWRFTPGEATESELLGITQQNYAPVCEASLYPTPTDILEDDEGKRYVLSYSHLYKYNPDAPTLDTRLPGIPASTLGHPGGRCLRFVKGELNFFTEFFGLVGQPQSAGEFAQFYNTLRTLDNRQQSRTGKGTCFHGNNCADVYLGDLYGIAQDKAFGEDSAQQFIAVLNDGVWQTAGMAPFPAASHHWQRVRSLATPGGMKLVVSGKAAVGENALWGTSDGVRFREAALNFRPRRLTRVEADGREYLYAVGRFVEEISVQPQWSVIRLSGAFVTISATWNDAAGDDGGFCMDKAEALAKGINPAALPPYLRWIPDGAQPAGGYWLPSVTEPDEPYLSLNIGSTTICYLLHGTLPYDPTIWPHLDFSVHDDGGIGGEAIVPVGGGSSPQDVIDDWETAHPGEVLAPLLNVKLTNGNVWTALQLNDVNDQDVNGQRPFSLFEQDYPAVWARFDSVLDADDLTAGWVRWPLNVLRALPFEVQTKIETCILVPESQSDLRAPVIMAVS